MSELIKRLEHEVFHLETINAYKSVPVKVGESEFPMYFDVEVLLREKRDELKQAHKFIKEVDVLTEELNGLEKQMTHLNESNEDEVTLYHVGVPFKFSRQELIEKIEKRKKIVKRHLEELNKYIETGEQTY